MREILNADGVFYSHLAQRSWLRGWPGYRSGIRDELMLSGRQDSCVWGEKKTEGICCKIYSQYTKTIEVLREVKE